MSTNDNNLLTFLKKQSLFSNSPGKNMNRKMSSRSREKKSEQPNPNNYNPNFNTQGGNNFQTSFNMNQTSLSPERVQGSYQDNNRVYYQNTNTQVPNQNGYGQTSQTNFGGQVSSQNNFGGQVQGGVNINGQYSQQQYSYGYEQNTNQLQFRPDRQYSKGSQGSTLLTNVVNYSTSFESARVQTAQRLQDLGSRVRAQITQLNTKIQSFNNQMMRQVSLQYNQVKERIHFIVEQTFRENEGFVREFLKTQELRFAEQILRARESLQREIENIEAMRQDINKPYWRNMAGVFITREFEGRIQAVIKQCQSIQVLKIDAQGFQMKDLEKQLYDRVVMRIQADRQSIYHH